MLPILKDIHVCFFQFYLWNFNFGKCFFFFCFCLQIFMCGLPINMRRIHKVLSRLHLFWNCTSIKNFDNKKYRKQDKNHISGKDGDDDFWEFPPLNTGPIIRANVKKALVGGWENSSVFVENWEQVNTHSTPIWEKRGWAVLSFCRLIL